MSEKKSIAFFDFDGTLTESDSFWQFIKFSQPKSKILMGAIWLSLTLTGFKLGIVSNSKAKIKVLNFLFKDWELKKLQTVSESFATECIPQLLRSGALERLGWHQAQGHEVCIVSASLEEYMKPWCNSIGVGCLATSLNVNHGKVVGGYRQPNCYGPEKVKRIQETYDLMDYHKIYAYGNSAGDKEMLDLADFPHFKSLG